MIQRRRRKTRPGHPDQHGRWRPQVGTLDEMLHRAQYGDPPEPFSIEFADRLMATLMRYPHRYGPIIDRIIAMSREA